MTNKSLHFRFSIFDFRLLGILLACGFCSLASALSQNVNVVNPASKPVPVDVQNAEITLSPTNLATSAKQDALAALLGTTTTAKSTATDTTAVPVIPLLKQISASVQAPPSHAVTNAGTFAVQATDAGPSWTTASGIAGARFTSADQSGAVASVTSAPTSGQKLVITDIVISVDTAMRVDFTAESSATVIESVYMAANSTVNLITRSKRKLATADKKLQVQTSASGNISVNAFYYSEP